ncbi:four helix bundle protein [Thermoproteota archaeon]
MESKIRRFRDLRVWQKSIELVKAIYSATKSFPEEEKYGLVQQMKRSAISVPSNIAEGFRRKHQKEYRQFLYIALGSCAELDTQVVIAKELNFIDNQKEIVITELIDYICRMIVNLQKKL